LRRDARSIKQSETRAHTISRKLHETAVGARLNAVNRKMLAAIEAELEKQLRETG
jgi:hypothetical protein